MKTIEERAKEFALRDFPGRDKMKESILELKESANETGYIAGATEQKAIDDANLQERFEKVLNGQKWDLIDKACEWLKARNVLTDASIEGFRKAMEE